MHLHASAPDDAPMRLFGLPLLHQGSATLRFLPERPFQLLAVLALRNGRWVPRDELAALFWPEHPLPEALRNLRKVVFKARSALGGAAPEAELHGLRWRIDTDVEGFRAALATGRWRDALQYDALLLLAGLEAGAGESLAEWIRAERRTAEGLWQKAARACLADRGLGSAERCALAERMLEVDASDEEAAAALIEAALAADEPVLAEQRYRSFARRLAEQFGLEPSGRLRGLLHRRPAAPTPPARLIGRRVELATLAAQLGDPGLRALAIVGPGGVGKSSLARAALASAPAPVAWIELQHLDSIGAVAARLARELDVGGTSGPDTPRALAAALGTAPRIIAFDNAEHLDGLAAFVDALLAETPSLRVLVTSRTRPGVAGETVLLLGGLEVPDEESRDAEAAAAFDAVRLFETRARAAQAGFDLRAHVEAMVAIVTAVGGLPLAIELAAGWVRLLPPAVIAADLAAAVGALERDPASAAAPARAEHTSLARVLAQSFALLVARERDALADLSEFEGGFGHPAARDVADASLPLLAALVDKSLLQVDAAGRFSMHPLIAAEARVRADADPARRTRTRDRHAAHFARVLGELAAAAGGDHRPLLRALKTEMANAQRAWRHAVASGHAGWLVPLVRVWRRHAVATARFAEGTELIEQLVTQQATAPAAVLAHARATLAWFVKCSGDGARAVAIAADVAGSAAAQAEPALMVDCFNTLGAAQLLLGDRAQARHWFGQSLAAAERHGLRAEMASALNNIGLAAMGDGDFARCEPLFERAAALQRELGDHVSLTRALYNLGASQMGRGEWSRARVAFEDTLRYAVAHEVESLRPVVEFMLGANLLEVGELDAAQRQLKAAQRRCAERRFEEFGFKAAYYLARADALRAPTDAALRALLGFTRRARDEGRGYDLLYLLAFVGEAVAARGAPDTALPLFDAAVQAQLADAYLRPVVAACRARCTAAQAGRPAGTALPVDRIAALVEDCDGHDELVARVRSALQ